MNPWITAADLFTLVAGFVLLLPRSEKPEPITHETLVHEVHQRLDLVDAPQETPPAHEHGQQRVRLEISAAGTIHLDGQSMASITEACAAIDGGSVVLAVEEAAPFAIPGEALLLLAGKARVELAAD